MHTNTSSALSHMVDKLNSKSSHVFGSMLLQCCAQLRLCPRTVCEQPIFVLRGNTLRQFRAMTWWHVGSMCGTITLLTTSEPATAARCRRAKQEPTARALYTGHGSGCTCSSHVHIFTTVLSVYSSDSCWDTVMGFLRVEINKWE